MVKHLEDLIGKWFSNVGGFPSEYYYILDARQTTHAVRPISAKYIHLKTRTIRITESDFRTLNVFGDPLIKERIPELGYLIHKTIRYLFEKEIKR